MKSLPVSLMPQENNTVIYVPTKLAHQAPSVYSYSGKDQSQMQNKKSLRELVQNASKTHFKGANEAIHGDTRSMRFKESEFKKLIKVENESPILN